MWQVGFRKRQQVKYGSHHWNEECLCSWQAGVLVLCVRSKSVFVIAGISSHHETVWLQFKYWWWGSWVRAAGEWGEWKGRTGWTFQDISSDSRSLPVRWCPITKWAIAIREDWAEGTPKIWGWSVAWNGLSAICIYICKITFNLGSPLRSSPCPPLWFHHIQFSYSISF